MTTIITMIVNTPTRPSLRVPRRRVLLRVLFRRRNVLRRVRASPLL